MYTSAPQAKILRFLKSKNTIFKGKSMVLVTKISKFSPGPEAYCRVIPKSWLPEIWTVRQKKDLFCSDSDWIENIHFKSVLAFYLAHGDVFRAQGHLLTPSELRDRCLQRLQVGQISLKSSGSPLYQTKGFHCLNSTFRL